MNGLVIFSLLVAAAVAAPVKEPCDTPAVAYSGFPLAYSGLPLAGVQLPQVAVAPVETRVHYAETPVVTGYTSQILKPAIGQAFAAPFLAGPAILDAPKEVETQADVKITPFAQFAPLPAPVLPAPVQVADAPKEVTVELKEVPAITSYAQFAPLPVPAPVAVAAPVETRVHYAETPVVTGYQTTIFKPAIGQAIAAPAFAPASVKVSAEEVKAVPVAPFATPLAYSSPIAAPLAYSAPVAYSNVNLDIPAPVPAGDAPAWEELVSQEKVLAPARAVSKITPQITNVVPEAKIEKVAIDVPVAKPYAQPVPVAVPTPVAQPYAHPVHVPVATPVAAPVAAPFAQFAQFAYSAPIAVKADC